MKKQEWNEGLNHLDPALVEEYILQKESLKKTKSKKKALLRITSLSACFVLVVGALLLPTALRQASSVESSSATEEESKIDLPLVHLRAPSAAPKLYGDLNIGPSGASGEINDSGLSVIAEPVEVLTDTYVFFDDYRQCEFYLLRMKTVKLLKGQKMAEEFYFTIPVEYMTDYTLYHSIAIRDMAQCVYENSVVYNKTQGEAEQIPLAIFSYHMLGIYLMGEDFIPFDEDGNFDPRLWESTAAWQENTNVPYYPTLAEAEKAFTDEYDYGFSAHSLSDLTEEALEVLESLYSFKNGLFIQKYDVFLHHYGSVRVDSVRYLNGFPTNERVLIFGAANGGEERIVYTKARFDETDLNALPDLTTAYYSVSEALDKGELSPPNFALDEPIKKLTPGVFGWYAKTEDGVLGIVRVNWTIFTENYDYYYDDAYFIVEYGGDSCTQIIRDHLLTKLGEYEATYIFDGEYDTHGKVFEQIYPMG